MLSRAVVPPVLTTVQAVCVEQGSKNCHEGSGAGSVNGDSPLIVLRDFAEAGAAQGHEAVSGRPSRALRPAPERRTKGSGSQNRFGHPRAAGHQACKSAASEVQVGSPLGDGGWRIEKLRTEDGGREMRPASQKQSAMDAGRRRGAYGHPGTDGV